MEFDAKLCEFAEVVMGQSPPGERVYAEAKGLPLLNGPTEFGPSHPRPVQWTDDVRKQSKVGDVLFCVRGSTTGRMNWADQPYAIGRGIAAIRGTNGFDTAFVRAVLEAGLSDLLALATGSTFPNLSRNDLLSVPAPRITAAESVEIGAFLVALDDRINHNRALAANLEAIARALFKSWFVDFDPVRAKAAGETPPGLASDLAALFPDRFVDSELGEIPEGWHAGTIDEVCRNIRIGCSATAIDADDFYVGLEHVDRRCLTLWQRGAGSDATSNKSRFKKGDLLFGKLRPYFHKVVVAPCDGICSTDILVIRSKADNERAFTHLTLFQDDVIQFVSDASGGTRMPRTNWETLAAFRIVVAPSEVRAAFDGLVRPLIEAAMIAVDESRVLAQMRDLLLPRLISGKLRVEDAEAALEAA